MGSATTRDMCSLLCSAHSAAMQQLHRHHFQSYHTSHWKKREDDHLGKCRGNMCAGVCLGMAKKIEQRNAHTSRASTGAHAARTRASGHRVCTRAAAASPHSGQRAPPMVFGTGFPPFLRNNGAYQPERTNNHTKTCRQTLRSSSPTR